LALWATAVGALTVAEAQAHGAASARLVYVRGPGAAHCPGGPAVRGAVSARLGYDPFLDWAPEVLFVEIRRSGHTFHVAVKLIDQNGSQRGARDITVRADDCSGVIDALGLSVSLTIDPVNALGPPSSAPPSPPAPPPEHPRRTTEPAQGLVVGPQVPFAGAGARRSSWSAHVGVGAIGSLKAAPSTSAGATLRVGLGWRALSLDVEGRIDAPATGDSDLPPVRVRSWLLVGSLVPCLHIGPTFACPVASVGRLGATSRNVARAVDKHGPWSAVGGRVGAEWPVRSQVTVQAYAQALATLTRDTLWIDATRVYAVPTWSVGLGASLAWRFQ
jgi:hypothetical protein